MNTHPLLADPKSEEVLSNWRPNEITLRRKKDHFKLKARLIIKVLPVSLFRNFGADFLQ